MTNKNFEGAQNVYILFALGGVLTFVPHNFAIIMGVLCVLAGCILAYINRDKTKSSDALHHNHARFQVRTFWICNLIALPLGMVANLIALLMFTDMGDMMNKVYGSGPNIDIGSIANDALTFEDRNASILFVIKCVTYGPVLIWWLNRMHKGWNALKASDLISSTSK